MNYLLMFFNAHCVKLKLYGDTEPRFIFRIFFYPLTFSTKAHVCEHIMSSQIEKCAKDARAQD